MYRLLHVTYPPSGPAGAAAPAFNSSCWTLQVIAVLAMPPQSRPRMMRKKGISGLKLLAGDNMLGMTRPFFMMDTGPLLHDGHDLDPSLEIARSGLGNFEQRGSWINVNGPPRKRPSDSGIPVPIPETSEQGLNPLILDYGAITSFPVVSTYGTPSSIYYSSRASYTREAIHATVTNLLATSSGELKSFDTSPSTIFILATPPLLAATPAATSATHIGDHPFRPPPNDVPLVTTTDEGGRPLEHGHGSQNLRSHRLSTAVIILLIFGIGCISLSLFLIFKLCCRTNRCVRPVPSMPILHEPYKDKKIQPPDSPLFGGTERISTRSLLDENYVPWTQYPRPLLDTDEQQCKVQTINNQSNKSQKVSTNRTSGVTISYCDTSSQTPTNSPRQGAFAHFHNALNRTASRTSAASFYPTSPGTSNVFRSDGIGVATIEPPSGTCYTGDGSSLLKRTKSRLSVHRQNRSSVVDGPRPPNVQGSRSSHSIEYDTTDAPSPSVATRIRAHPVHVITTPPTASLNGGRTRIKSSYISPGLYPRVSAPLANKIGADTTGTRAMKYEHIERTQETQALSAVLGLTTSREHSSISSRPGLYSEDPANIYEIQQATRGAKIHRRQQSQATSGRHTPLDTSLNASNLGNLMLLGYAPETLSSPSQKSEVENPRAAIMDHHSAHPAPAIKCMNASLTLTANLPPSFSRKDPFVYDNSRQHENKPPRVPSPPQIPSLTQLALEHSNPQSYYDYHSPTYSIYGLYEHERKSRLLISENRDQ